VVNADVSTGAIKYGGIGWLYGLGENDYILDSKITALVHPGYSGQRAPNGAQHDYGDVLNVVAQAERVGMLGVDIYVQDYYAEWPYPNHGIDSYIENVLNPVIDAVIANPYRTFMRYVPFNEPDWIWYATSGPKFAQFLDDWKKVYSVIKTRDGAEAQILGPGFMHYNAAAYDAFMVYCQENQCLPDVVTWHELTDDFFDVYYLNYDNYRRIERKYGIAEREVYINEYGRQNLDIPRPGQLIQYLARFENTKVWAAMAFWTGGNKLDDLLTDEGFQQGRETGAYWLYKWYGEMTGNTVEVVLPNLTGPLQAIATSSTDNTVQVIFGGSANEYDVNTIDLVINGLSPGTIRYEIYETNYTTGYHPESEVRTSGTTTVTDGQVLVTVADVQALSAYLVDLQPE
jgi:hypothetical protein